MSRVTSGKEGREVSEQCIDLIPRGEKGEGEKRKRRRVKTWPLFLVRHMRNQHWALFFMSMVFGHVDI